MPEFLEVKTTTARRDGAQQIAQLLVERRLAACVHIRGPITSVYRWQDTVEKDEEWQCTIKTTRELFPAVEQVIREHHPYDVPEIIAVPIVAGSDDYLKWLAEMTSPQHD